MCLNACVFPFCNISILLTEYINIVGLNPIVVFPLTRFSTYKSSVMVLWIFALCVCILLLLICIRWLKNQIINVKDCTTLIPAPLSVPWFQHQLARLTRQLQLKIKWLICLIQTFLYNCYLMLCFFANVSDKSFCFPLIFWTSFQIYFLDWQLCKWGFLRGFNFASDINSRHYFFHTICLMQ